MFKKFLKDFIGKLLSIRDVLKNKNMQIKAEREKYEAERMANVILSAYIALLVAEHGAVRIPKKEISDALGRYIVRSSSSGDDYVIEVSEALPDARKEGACIGETGII